MKLRADRRIPAVLDAAQIEAVLGSCLRLRDRLLSEHTHHARTDWQLWVGRQNLFAECLAEQGLADLIARHRPDPGCEHRAIAAATTVYR